MSFLVENPVPITQGEFTIVLQAKLDYFLGGDTYRSETARLALLIAEEVASPDFFYFTGR